MHRTQISGGLFACLIGIYLPIAQYLFLPTPLTHEAGQEAWIAVLLAGLAGLGVGMLCIWVSVRHPGLGPAQIARRLLGKWAGGAVGLVYAGYITYVFGLGLRDVIDFSQAVLLPGTPGLAIIILFAGISLYGAWHGLEPVVRVAFQTVIVLVMVPFLMPVLELREITFKNLDPFLYRGIGSVFRAAFLALGWFCETVTCLSLVPHLKHPQKAWRWLIIGVALATLPLTLMTAHTTLVFGAELPSRFLFPIYYVIEMISIAKILERIESFLVIVFLSGMFIKSALYLFIAAETTAHALGLKSHRWPALGVTLAGAVIAHMVGSMLNLIEWETKATSTLQRLGVEIGLPVLLLIASLIARSVRRRGSAHA